MIGVASYMGHWDTCPLDFQLFNFSGHFRAAKTLTLDVVAYSERIYWLIALLLFIAPNPDDATDP